jgi:hypothetical protein
VSSKKAEAGSRVDVSEEATALGGCCIFARVLSPVVVISESSNLSGSSVESSSTQDVSFDCLELESLRFRSVEEALDRL